MPKNILIFADGTSQIGGLRPDQRQSNIYKMYRAMRPGPESPISYHDQLAYYDPGLGAGEVDGITGSKIRNFFEASVGAGIEKNMIDCYEKIIAHYQAGDQVVLIGFSRGAYTVRALANMMNLCGIPTQLADGSPIPKDGPKLRKVAAEAVNSVYSHGTGKKRGAPPYFQQREEKGRRFRVRYRCSAFTGTGDVRGNVEPTFVGVFDSVAALQNSVIAWLVRVGFWVPAGIFAISVFRGWHWTAQVGLGVITGLALYGYLRTLMKQIRYFEPDLDKPLRLWNPRNWKIAYANVHRAYWRKENYDRWLSPQVGFARHALAIDESRADFPRVEWGSPAASHKKAGQHPEWLKQVWFAGCHSDIGGSYPEDESRLSDIALQWMVNELKECCPSILVRDELLRITPDPRGLQHEEVWVFRKWFLKLRWTRKPRQVGSDFPLHPTVLERLAAPVVPQSGKMAPYRPIQLSGRSEATKYYLAS